MYERDISAGSDDSFMDRLNPGQSAEATLAYDLTPGTEIDHMLVNGKRWSTKVYVSTSGEHAGPPSSGPPRSASEHGGP